MYNPQLRSKEAEFGKEKAILQQKVELLELQLKDSIDREESQRRMHETMINCLKKDDPRQSNVKDSQTAAEKAAQQEILELREQKKKLIEEYENREKDLKGHIADKDQMIKELQSQLERMISDKRSVQYQLESEIKDYQAKIQILSSERDQIAEKMELKNQTKVNLMSMEIEKLKLEHQREMEKIKADYDGSLKEIKYFHEQEKNNLEHRVERSTNELRSLLSHNHLQQQNDKHISERKEELEKQIEFLHNEVENVKNEYESQLELLKLEKEQAESQCRKVQRQLEKLKSAPKPIKIDLIQPEQDGSLQKQVKNLQSEVTQLQGENEKLSEQIKKLRRELLDNQDYIEKIEQNERKLRTMLKERESDLDSEKIDLKKQLNQEKKKSIEVQEATNRLRDSFEKTKNKHLQDLLEKDEKIIKLTRELRECEKKLSDNHKTQRNQSPFGVDHNHNRTISYSPINSSQQPQQHLNFAFSNQQNPNISNLNIQVSPRGSSQQFAPQQIEKLAMKQITQLEFTLLKTCQRMADSASRMECSHCFLTFDTSDFYDHLMQEHPLNNKCVITTTASQLTHHHSQISIGNSTQGYGSIANTQNNLQGHNNLAKRHFIEDTNMSQSLSPKSAAVMQSRNAKQQFNQNSRSFTCLLNEIEEEEKLSGDSKGKKDKKQLSKGVKRSQHSSKQSKDVQQVAKDKDYKRSRNTNNSTVLIGNTNSTIGGGQGNTISSVLRSQRQQKHKVSNEGISSQQQQLKHHMNATSVSPAPQVLSVNTACRTEIQNLKKQNKKLTSQLLNQESKIQDISRDCSALKKKAIKEETQKSSKLTNEIKDLLEKLVSYQGVPTQSSQQTKKESGQFTSRQMGNNMPMNTESIVQLRSSTSMSSLSGLSQQQTRKFKNKSKSPIDSQVLTARNHCSNKENQNQQSKHSHSRPKQQSFKVPELKYLPQPMMEENHQSSSEDNRHPHNNQHFHQNSCSSKCQTERRFNNNNDSGTNCTNSPTRYQNYFEILQSIPSSIQEINHPTRYSPTQESTQKMNSYRLYQVNQTKGNVGGQSRNNSNLPMVYNSKYTNNSSQHNLVLYDSTNTDMFKSKNLFNKNSCGKHQHTGTGGGYQQVTNMRKLEFDEQCCYIEDENKLITSSSCPSLDDFEEDSQHQMVTEDPFVTGRFCQGGCDNNNGKQFVFKQSKNNTLKTLNLNQ